MSSIGSLDGTMDMMQLVSLLMIPALREAQDDDADKNKNDLIVYTLEMLLHDVTGHCRPKPLTESFLKKILQAYGEEELAENEDLIQQMLEQAGASNGQRVLLDAKTFLKALTADVQQFDTGNKDKLSTNFDDALYGETRLYNNHTSNGARRGRRRRRFVGPKSKKV